jgi:hypothetical protein
MQKEGQVLDGSMNRLRRFHGDGKDRCRRNESWNRKDGR